MWRQWNQWLSHWGQSRLGPAQRAKRWRASWSFESCDPCSSRSCLGESRQCESITSLDLLWGLFGIRIPNIYVGLLGPCSMDRKNGTCLLCNVFLVVRNQVYFSGVRETSIFPWENKCLNNIRYACVIRSFFIVKQLYLLGVWFSEDRRISTIQIHV